MSLTVQGITALQPGETLRDRDVPGLHVRAFPARKSFYLFYRTSFGEQRRPKLGDYGVLTINDARRIAREMLLAVAAGQDPSAKRKADRGSPTVNKLIDIYSEQPKARIAKHVLRHIREQIGTKRVKSLDLQTVKEAHARVSRQAPIQANRVLAGISTLLTFAERLQLRPAQSNFCYLIEKNPENRRERYLTPGEEAKAVGEALRAKLYGDQHEAALFVLLLILTGARKSEIGNAKVEDRKGGVLVVEKHKTARKTGTKYIHLPRLAEALLDDPRRPQHHRVGYLVGVADPRKLWDEIRVKCGCPDLRLHDLRHSFASFGVANNIELKRIGGLLGHADVATTNRYAHLLHGPAVEDVNRIADTAADALGLEVPA